MPRLFVCEYHALSCNFCVLIVDVFSVRDMLMYTAWGIDIVSGGGLQFIYQAQIPDFPIPDVLYSMYFYVGS